MDQIRMTPLGKIEVTPSLSPSKQPAASSSLPAANYVRAADVPTLITMARSVASEGPPVNEALIVQLRAALADGSYRIDPDRIAKAMQAFFSRP